MRADSSNSTRSSRNQVGLPSRALCEMLKDREAKVVLAAVLDEIEEAGKHEEHSRQAAELLRLFEADIASRSNGGRSNGR